MKRALLIAFVVMPVCWSAQAQETPREQALHFIKNETQFHLDTCRPSSRIPKRGASHRCFQKDTAQGIRMLLSVDDDIPPVAKRVSHQSSLPGCVRLSRWRWTTIGRSISAGVAQLAGSRSCWMPRTAGIGARPLESIPNFERVRRHGVAHLRVMTGGRFCADQVCGKFRGLHHLWLPPDGTGRCERRRCGRSDFRRRRDLFGDRYGSARRRCQGACVLPVQQPGGAVVQKSGALSPRDRERCGHKTGALHRAPWQWRVHADAGRQPPNCLSRVWPFEAALSDHLKAKLTPAQQNTLGVDERAPEKDAGAGLRTLLAQIRSEANVVALARMADGGRTCMPKKGGSPISPRTTC